MSYLKKFPFRPLLLTLLILVSITAIVAGLVNNFLAKSKVTIEQNLSNIFNQKVSIEKIIFLPPNFIVLKNASINQGKLVKETQPISVERIKCSFSLPTLISKKDFVVTQMSLDRPSVNYLFIKENIKEIVELINSLKQEQPLGLKVRGACLDVSEEDGVSQWINLDASFIIDPGNSIFSSGSICFRGLFKNDNSNRFFSASGVGCPRYILRAFLTKEGWIVENVELNSPQFYLRLHGTVEKNVLKMDGSLSLNILSGNDTPYKNRYTIIDSLKKFLSNYRTNLPGNNVSAPDLNVYDLSCVIKLDFPHIEIEDMNFSLKDVPFRLNGTVSLLRALRLNLKFSSFPNQPQEVRLKNPKRFDINLEGIIQERRFNGLVNFYFLRTAKEAEFLERIEATLNTKFSSVK